MRSLGLWIVGGVLVLGVGCGTAFTAGSGPETDAGTDVRSGSSSSGSGSSGSGSGGSASGSSGGSSGTGSSSSGSGGGGSGGSSGSGSSSGVASDGGGGGSGGGQDAGSEGGSGVGQPCQPNDAMCAAGLKCCPPGVAQLDGGGYKCMATCPL
jgi:hypothetical protein